MNSIFNKIKPLAAGILLFSFVTGISLNSCTGNKQSEKTENASENSEHPAGSEHPSGEEEHPSSVEHPSDSTEAEHPAN